MPNNINFGEARYTVSYDEPKAATDSMIERVARAIALAHFERKRASLVHPDRPKYLANTQWKLFEDDARAAIEAMREPTKTMFVTGCGCDHCSPSSTEYVWQAMIDAALNEKART